MTGWPVGVEDPPAPASGEVCTIEYTPEEAQAQATLVEVGGQHAGAHLAPWSQVTFSKECSKQMVTVCQPGYHAPGYGGYGHTQGAHLPPAT